MPARIDVSGYNASLEELSGALDKVIDERVAQIGDLTGKAAHDEIMDWFEPMIAAASDDAAVVSGRFYNAVREISLGEPLESSPQPLRDASRTERAVWAFQNEAKDSSALGELLKDRARYEIRRSAGNAMQTCGWRDPRTPRFARVPGYSKSYGDGCPFCRMLASRGFVYLSAKSVGSDGHYHGNCRCTVVPGWSTYDLPSAPGGVRKGSLLTQVRGYDPEALYDGYLEDLKSGKLKLSDVARSTSHTARWSSKMFSSSGEFTNYIRGAESIEDLQYRCAVVEQEWPKTGLSDRHYNGLRRAVMRKKQELNLGDGGEKSLPTKVKEKYDGTMFDDGYKKALSELDKKSRASWDSTVNEFLQSISSDKGYISAEYMADIKGHELVAARWLSEHGHDVYFIRASKVPGSHTPDLLLDGVPFEIKRIESTNPESVFRNCWQASAQSENVIIDISLGTVSYGDAYAMAKSALNAEMHRYLSRYEKKMGASYGEKKTRIRNVWILDNGELTVVER